MPADPARCSTTSSESTHSLQRSIAGLTDEQARGPSLLPGWTRGHVVDPHRPQRRRADQPLRPGPGPASRRRCTPAARSATPTIEAQSGRPAAELVEDVEIAHERFMAAAARAGRVALAGARSAGVRPDATARRTVVPWLRRMEVEVHHVDLDLDYTLAHWPEDFVERLLAETAADFSDARRRRVVHPDRQRGPGPMGRRRRRPGDQRPSPGSARLAAGPQRRASALHTDGSLPDIGAWR